MTWYENDAKVLPALPCSGVTSETVHAAGDESFWAYGDFSSVVESFSRDAEDPERRVLGIEGIASGAQLKAAIASGKRSLKLGHLSLKMMKSKVANGENSVNTILTQDHI